MALMVRLTLIIALYERGVLREFEIDGAPGDQVFRAAATLPITRDDFGEAVLQSELKKKSTEEAAKIKAEWLAEGYDADQPKIDKKFLAAVREA